jgi:hypothetical protein
VAARIRVSTALDTNGEGVAESVRGPKVVTAKL